MKAKIFLKHLAMAALVSGVLLFVEVAVQQSYREAANDPQIQMAADIGYKLAGGHSIQQVLPTDTTELEHSPGIFVALYDKAGKPLASTTNLGGKLPQIPVGVFANADKDGENYITWQPQAGVREAVVVRSVASPTVAYVAVGRSLNGVEVREANLLRLAALTWIVAMVVILVMYALELSYVKGLKKE